MSKKIVYIDMDNVLADYDKAFKLAINKNPAIGFPQSQYGFFLNLEPVDAAIESVKLLLKSDLYDVYVMTAPSIQNPLCYTEKRVWIERYFGLEFVEKLIISSNKSLLKGEYLIDDHVSGKGQESFEGELIHFGSSRFPDWDAVQDYLSRECANKSANWH